MRYAGLGLLRSAAEKRPTCSALRVSWYCGAAAAVTSDPRCAARYAIVALRCMISAVADRPAATVSGEESAVGCASPALNCASSQPLPL